MARRKNVKRIDPRYFLNERRELTKEEIQKAIKEMLEDDPSPMGRNISSYFDELDAYRKLSTILDVGEEDLQNTMDQMGLSIVPAESMASSEEQKLDVKFAHRAPEYSDEDPLEEGGCGDHAHDETQTIVIDDEEAAATPMDTAEGLADELMSVAQRVMDMLGQGTDVSSLPDEQVEFMTENIIKEVLKVVLMEDKSGKGKCPSDGCVQKRAGHWVVISNKTGECWGRSKKKGGKCTQYDSRSDAEAALDAYHA